MSTSDSVELLLASDSFPPFLTVLFLFFLLLVPLLFLLVLLLLLFLLLSVASSSSELSSSLCRSLLRKEAAFLFWDEAVLSADEFERYPASL